jgi:hypothetical protein
MDFVKDSGSASMWRLRWSISVYMGKDPFSLKSVEGLAPALTGKSVTDFPCDAVADPFLLRRGEHWYLFFEAVNSETRRGEIAYATSHDGMQWIYGGLALREGFHLSYPYVWETNGEVYMVPETRQANSIRLYVAVDFPTKWKCISILRQGPYADSSICFHEGRWWMFTQRGLDELQLLTSERLEDGWSNHPASPLCAGNRIYSRPGGRILNYAGDWYRFAQDGVLSYGNNLRAMRIDRWNAAAFKEHEIADSPILKASLKGWNAMGMHHLDAVEVKDDLWLGVVDGATVSL